MDVETGTLVSISLQDMPFECEMAHISISIDIDIDIYSIYTHTTVLNFVDPRVASNVAPSNDNDLQP